MQPIHDPDAMSIFARTITQNKYAHTKSNGNKESWREIATRVPRSVMQDYLPDQVGIVEKLIAQRKFMPGGRYLYAAGRPYPQCQNCFCLDVEDSRESWADLMRRATNALMTGGGIGVVYSKLRHKGALVRGMGGESSGPVALMQMVNEAGRFIKQGGSRRVAIWAGLHWNHPDIFEFIDIKNWRPELVALKAKDFNAAAPMDMTNMSVILDDGFFIAYERPGHPDHDLAHRVYWTVIRQMRETAEPGFSIDVGEHSGEHLRNACTEFISRDNNDTCNLASLNLARIGSKDELAEATWNGVAFQICGSLYSVLPIREMYPVREKNRRIGLGLMGIHEWLLVRGKKYGPDAELSEWLEIYRDVSDKAAIYWADKLGVSRPVARRAVAPTGTIAIVAETTSALEPIFAIAVKRRYLHGESWKYQHIIDACAERLINRGIDPAAIEDAYDLGEDVERRVAFQAYIQSFVDMGCSSTINLPRWGSSTNNEQNVRHFGETLYKYLPQLRGITVYPDGARGGQPLNRVPYEEAKKYVGIELEEGGENCRTSIEELGNERACVNGVCGV